jgi:hypothetical protein
MYLPARKLFLAIVLCLAASATPARASIMERDLGGGWKAVWDDLGGLVDVTSNGVLGDAVFIEKSAEFREGPVGGVFPSIVITFTQTESDAVGSIVIDDEIIRNETGVDWTDFHFEVSGGGNVQFDPVATDASDGPDPIGFSIEPFTQAEFAAGNTELDVWDGVVADQSTWFPGDGATDGQLWIDVTPEGDTSFDLIETPTPEPMTLVLLAGAGLLGMLRRR